MSRFRVVVDAWKFAGCLLERARIGCRPRGLGNKPLARARALEGEIERERERGSERERDSERKRDSEREREREKLKGHGYSHKPVRTCQGREPINPRWYSASSNAALVDGVVPTLGSSSFPPARGHEPQGGLQERAG